MNDFDTQLREWYEAEISGIAFFETLARSAQEDEEVGKWSLLARLESIMAERLSARCKAAAIALPDQPSDSGYLDAARKMGGRPWLINMKALMGQLDEALIRIRSLAEGAPAVHAEIAGDFLAHEEALAGFVRAELNGEDGAPVVESLLGEWS